MLFDVQFWRQPCRTTAKCTAYVVVVCWAVSPGYAGEDGLTCQVSRCDMGRRQTINDNRHLGASLLQARIDEDRTTASPNGLLLENTSRQVMLRQEYVMEQHRQETLSQFRQLIVRLNFTRHVELPSALWPHGPTFMCVAARGREAGKILPVAPQSALVIVFLLLGIVSVLAVSTLDVQRLTGDCNGEACSRMCTRAASGQSKDPNEEGADTNLQSACVANGSRMRTGNKLRGFVLLHVATLLFGTDEVLIQYVEKSGVPQGLLLLGRFSVAALVMAPWVLRGMRQSVLCMAALELGLWLFLGFVALAMGLQYTTAAKASVILSFTTVLVPLLASLDNQRIPAKNWASGFGAVLGVIFLAVGGGGGMSPLPEGLGSPELLGDGLAILAAAMFAMYVWRGEKLARRCGGQTLELVSVQMCVVSGLAFAYVLGSEFWAVTSSSSFVIGIGALASHVCALPLGVLAAVAFMGVATTAFCMWAETEGLATVEATTAALVYSLEPLWGALFAWMFLAQALHGPFAWFGAALLVASSIVGQWPDVEHDQIHFSATVSSLPAL